MHCWRESTRKLRGNSRSEAVLHSPQSVHPGPGRNVTDLSAFARRLRAYRQAASLTQHELAARAGMSAAAVRDLEQGRTLRPRPGSIARLAAALGLAAHDICDLQQAAAPTAPPTSAATELDQDDHETTITILGPLSIRRGSIE